MMRKMKKALRPKWQQVMMRALVKLLVIGLAFVIVAIAGCSDDLAEQKSVHAVRWKFVVDRDLIHCIAISATSDAIEAGLGYLLQSTVV